MEKSNRKGPLSKDTLHKIYLDIDKECIGETNSVTMSVVKKVLVSYGGESEKME